MSWRGCDVGIPCWRGRRCHGRSSCLWTVPRSPHPFLPIGKLRGRRSRDSPTIVRGERAHGLRPGMVRLAASVSWLMRRYSGSNIPGEPVQLFEGKVFLIRHEECVALA
jgi:hypothetical protein